MKLLKVAVVMALVVLMAAPAFAEMKLNGYYRLQGTTLDSDNDLDDADAITQRLRMKLTNSLTENVGFVFYGEVDLDWGVNGDVGIDARDLEVKNAYLYINDDAFSAKLGGQGYGDIFNGLVISEDIMAITANYKFGAADLGLAYGKLAEGNDAVDDDRDFYAATVAFAATDAVKLSAGVYVDDFGAMPAVVGSGFLYNSATGLFNITDPGTPAEAAETNVYYGARVDAMVSDALNLSFFGVIADMEDGDTYVLDASAKMKMGNGSLAFEALYAPDEDDTEFGDIANFMYNGQNLMFLTKDVAATNNGYTEGKYQAPLFNGDGLTMLMLSGNYDFDAFYAGFGFGWADTDLEELGTEIGVKIGKKFYGNVDVSVRAAQWSAGEYGGAEIDEQKVIGMVNVGF